MTIAPRFSMPRPGDFRGSIEREFSGFLTEQAQRFPEQDRLRIDLHCHDLNSDQPDELWGRILGLPETWLETRDLLQCLRQHGSSAITVTNHNNARSCWDLLDKGEDVLVGAEFTCFFPEYELFSHVLTYGFTPSQEVVLCEKRQNIYEFLRYTTEQDLPVVLPHPLYFYTRNDKIDLELFEKLAVMFQRFEVLNGQRDLWQSTLTLNWARGLSEEKIHSYAQKHQLDPAEFGVDPARPKLLTGGSDDHMGLFAGECGTYLHVPDLAEKLQHKKASELALEALRRGEIAPYGHVGENQKLGIALLDYFAQISNNIEDPGLLRILLHRGETRDRVACFAIANVMLELKKRKHARKFFGFVHQSLQGKKPGKMLKWKLSGKYKYAVRHLERIADSRKLSSEQFVDTVNSSINELFRELNLLIIEKVQTSGLLTDDNRISHLSTEELTRKLEIPSQLSALLLGGDNRHTNINSQRLSELLEGISFPLLVLTVLTGATLTSTRVLYKNRPFLNRFANHIGCNHHDHRALHLTDTLFDKNGVCNSLRAKLRQAQDNDLALDFLTCHEDAKAEPHLHVVRPLGSFTLPESGGQQLRIPDLLEVARVFYDGGYDRIVCSTEGPMVAVALFLKYMFNIPCYFFMHTDWIEYIRCTMDLTQHERDRVRRVLRLLYQQFDGVFVLNSEHRDWLTSFQMELEPERVHLTAHAAPTPLPGTEAVNKSELFPDAGPDTPVLLVACRLSREKGVFELPDILARSREAIPDLRLVVAGSGPDEAALREALPDAHFTGWIDQAQLAALYAGLDLFVFPSRFDTFGNVLLEAFAYGMPAAAYGCKGPADIVEHDRCGYLVEDAAAMADVIVQHFRSPERHAELRANALARAAHYNGDRIMTQYIQDLGLPAPSCLLEQRSIA